MMATIRSMALVATYLALSVSAAVDLIVRYTDNMVDGKHAV